MQEHSSLLGYYFRRAPKIGIVEIINEGSYVVAEYDQRTGSVQWQRVVLAAHRTKIEEWLERHYQEPAAPPPPVETPAPRKQAAGAKRLTAAKAARSRKPRRPSGARAHALTKR